jgi:hypothetical protein
MTRRFRRILRIRRTVALALAVTAVAAPAAVADTPVGSDQLSIHARNGGGQVVVDRVTPDARDAARPVPPIDRVSPDARDNGRREPAPVVVSGPTVAEAHGFDWQDAAIGAAAVAALLILAGGTTVLTRRRPVRAS